MDTRELDKIVSDIGSNPLSTIVAMMLSANRNFNEKYTKEQQLEMKQNREAIRKEEVRCANIRQGICPSCEGKLIRGKKDKRNNYKRSWDCKECKEMHLA